MKKQILLAVFAFLFVVGAYAQEMSKKAHADIINSKGDKIGTAKLEEAQGGVKISVEVSQLPEGTHAIHIHDAGKCDPPDFKTAGPHFNPEGKKHGAKNPEGPHAGDLPNFQVGSDGHARFSIVASRVTLGDGRNSLFHPGGTALVIHEKADDEMTDPAGNSGGRIACGAVQK